MVSPVPFPEQPGITCDDMVKWTIQWGKAWEMGNAKLDAIRKWGNNGRSDSL